MNYVHATVEFLTYLAVERNYSAHTVAAYTDDLKSFKLFLTAHNRSLMLDDLRTSTCRRFIQDQVMNHQIQPRTIQRKISCLKSFNKFWLKENFTTVDFTSSIKAPKADSKLPVYNAKRITTTVSLA